MVHVCQQLRRYVHGRHLQQPQVHTTIKRVTPNASCVMSGQFGLSCRDPELHHAQKPNFALCTARSVLVYSLGSCAFTPTHKWERRKRRPLGDQDCALTMRFALKSSPEVPAGRVVPSSGSLTTLKERGIRSSPTVEFRLRVIDDIFPALLPPHAKSPSRFAPPVGSSVPPLAEATDQMQRRHSESSVNVLQSSQLGGTVRALSFLCRVLV